MAGFAWFVVQGLQTLDRDIDIALCTHICVVGIGTLGKDSDVMTIEGWMLPHRIVNHLLCPVLLLLLSIAGGLGPACQECFVTHEEPFRSVSAPRRQRLAQKRITTLIPCIPRHRHRGSNIRTSVVAGLGNLRTCAARGRLVSFSFFGAFAGSAIADLLNVTRAVLSAQLRFAPIEVVGDP